MHYKVYFSLKLLPLVMQLHTVGAAATRQKFGVLPSPVEATSVGIIRIQTQHGITIAVFHSDPMFDCEVVLAQFLQPTGKLASWSFESEESDQAVVVRLEDEFSPR